jgi:hypothetical protein
MLFCFVLDGDGVDTYQVEGERMRFAVSHATFSDQVRSGFIIRIRYAPRASTPQDESFSERKRLAEPEGVQVGVTSFSKEGFSSKLFIGLNTIIFARSSMLYCG